MLASLRKSSGPSPKADAPNGRESGGEGSAGAGAGVAVAATAAALEAAREATIQQGAEIEQLEDDCDSLQLKVETLTSQLEASNTAAAEAKLKTAAATELADAAKKAERRVQGELKIAQTSAGRAKDAVKALEATLETKDGELKAMIEKYETVLSDREGACSTPRTPRTPCTPRTLHTGPPQSAIARALFRVLLPAPTGRRQGNPSYLLASAISVFTRNMHVC